MFKIRKKVWNVAVSGYIFFYMFNPIIIPASRIQRPVIKGNVLMNSRRLGRILDEMEFAAKHGEVYHLWWHPHNFGKDPIASLKELDQILDLYKKLNETYGMQSLHRKE